ncbi:mas-related G-protein coupled receptor member D [Phascolarctos cinereus]|uniref:Mas-related G-protein coupled receptor member D n=1 Tax=Phascolarctos cinereus TaxID=38626 RepID=A0A6P5J6D2_PHACI|nr:mas-related G-protein coupled receptor member D [Phascolarctos cinereus]
MICLFLSFISRASLPQSHGPPSHVTMIVTVPTATNSTEEGNVSPLEIAIVIALLCLCGLVGNGTVIWLLRFGIKKNPYSVYIFNLAIADFFFLLCMFLSSVLNRPEFGPWSWHISEVFRRTRCLAYVLGLSLLAAIGTQRCLSVLFPNWYRCHRPRNLSSLVCAVLWVLAILESLAAIYFCVVQKENKNSCRKVDLFFMVLIFGIFTPAMCVSGLTLFIKARRISLKHQPARLYIIILVTILVFLICALPLSVHWFIIYWLCLRERPNVIFYGVAKIFSCVNSTANPIIYFMVGSQRKKRFHEPLRVTLERALWDEKLGLDSRGAQDGGEDNTNEELPRVTTKCRDPQPV